MPSDTVVIAAEPAPVIPATEAEVLHAETRVAETEAETTAAVEIAEAQAEATIAVAEAEAEATVAVAALTLEQTSERLLECETQIAELRVMVSTLMTAMETQQATIVSILTPPQPAPNSEAILEAEPEPEPVTVPPNGAVEVEHPAVRIRHARRRLI